MKYVIGEETLQEFFREMLLSDDEFNDYHPVKRVDSFEEAMLLTTNRGLVIAFRDGSEFQVTIVQSKFAK